MPTPRSKDFSVARRSMQKYQFLRGRTFEDEHSDDDRRDNNSHRYRINTESVGVLECQQGPLEQTTGRLLPRTSVKPLKKFVPRLQMLSHFERVARASPRSIGQLMHHTTKNLAAGNTSESYFAATNKVKPPRSKPPQFLYDRKGLTKRRIANAKVSLLEQLSMNSKNKVGTQMLIINEF